MFRFFVYLLETGICLSLLYLAYWLFMRKETYFNFNRMFLVGTILLALVVPLLHLNLSIRPGGSLEEPALRILKFRNYYEDLVRWTEADFGTEPERRHSISGRQVREEARQDLFMAEGSGGLLPETGGSSTREMLDPSRKRLSPARILILIYITGVLYFFTRFIYLVIRLFLIAEKNGVTRLDGFRMVEMKEDIAPFSFFRYLFIHRESFGDQDLKTVLAHERAHIRQRHSLDHILAHALAVFQWFNPLAWQLRGALKTTHEYIADRQVISRGFESFDYQSLLLKQVIGYHSVELVNNFNLKPIKKRIAMMTKRRSGIPARLKAMLVIPFTLAVFLLFADFTLKGPEHRLLNLNVFQENRSGQLDLAGLWVKKGDDEFNDLLFFTPEKCSFSEGTQLSREYFWRTENDALVLSTRKNGEEIRLKIEPGVNLLRIWWTDASGSTYERSHAENTMDLLLGSQPVKINLPVLTQYRLMEVQSLLYRIGLGYDGTGNVLLAFNGRGIDLKELPGLIQEERNKLSKLDAGDLTAMLFIDREMPMRKVTELKNRLRETGSLKFADAGYPHGGAIPSEFSDKAGMLVSPLLYHTVAIPRLLPPMDAVYMDKEDVEKSGMKIFVIDLGSRNTTPASVDRELEQFIRENRGGKYVISLEYDGEIPYEQYIESVDMVFKVVYRFRDELAMEKHRVHYAELGSGLQKEIRKAYPMVLSEAWTGE